MNEITKIKNEVKLKHWAKMVKCRNESGLTVTEWCSQNGINPKTYYYRLKRVRQVLCSEIETHDIVPVLADNKASSVDEKIELSVANVKISLPYGFNSNTRSPDCWSHAIMRDINRAEHITSQIYRYAKNNRRTRGYHPTEFGA